MTPPVCPHCKEPVLSEDPFVIIAFLDIGATKFHKECGLRMIIGGVGHQLKTCGCYVPGATETDPPELTIRQAARLACELFQQNNPMEEL